MGSVGAVLKETMASLTLGSTLSAPGTSFRMSGSCAACATFGEGRDSTTDTSTATERGNHEAKTVVRRSRGSRDRITCGGMLRLRDLMIFSSMTGSPFEQSPPAVAL